MLWLPGAALFGSHTPVIWLNALLGGLLGFIGGRLRSSGTVFEGKPWMLALTTLAGVVGGVAITLFWGLAVALLAVLRGDSGIPELVVLSVLSQLAAFTFLVLRQRA